ncbi:MAG: ATP synthase F1 subunit gamma [Bacteroidia bacterium]
MSNQKEIRARISSTISTQQITKAMKLVSATKLRKASEAIMRMRPYAMKLQGIMSNLQESVDDDKLAVYFKQREVKKVALVVISSDRGLCGAFNANVYKQVRRVIDEKYKDLHAAGNVEIICVGKKAAESLGRVGYMVNTEFMSMLNGLSAEKSFEFSEILLKRFRAGEIDKLEVVYNQFKNAATQILTSDALLPVTPSEDSSDQAVGDYLFEPNKVAILEDLIPRSLKTHMYRAMLDSLASEHGARMVAMDKATENAGELLSSLRLAYNQARQAAITREISEIVGGVAALEDAG